VQVKMERGDSMSMLEIDVEIPTKAVAKIKVRA
jgi:hypothetical protein